MKKITLTIVVVLALASILYGFEHNFRDYDKRGPMPEHHQRTEEDPGFFERLCEELELTDYQIEQMEQMHINQKKRMIQIKSEIEILKIDKWEALKNHNFTQAKEIIEVIADKKLEIALTTIDNMEKRWDLLSDEQKAEAEELMKDRPFRHKMKKMSEKKK